MKIIALADKKWAIGRGGKLLVSIPEDMQLFRQETRGKVVIMGRKTLESLPAGEPLYERRNIVLTRDMSYKKDNAVICHSVEEVLEYVKQYNDDDIYVIGGGEVYEQFLPYCNIAHITKVDYTYDADCYMPNLDKDKSWKISRVSEEKTYFDICYEFAEYTRIQ
ncbi:MAG: dihydrofolate reductase [Eubacteriales bacterium]|nr:dihydrofolate reductase [Eubacteriales bacterium]